MVLCNYFLNGHCRFGSKCVNDHIDLKILLKTEIESAINGKQWLLSCFGPFKESTVVPNLQDRSFEEVRLDFLEASKSGNAQQHVMELISQYNDSMAKLNQLKMASPDTIQMVANIYNQSVQDQKTPTAINSTPSSIFSAPTATVNSSQTQNPFQLTNVFGANQAQPAQAMNAGSIFGGAPANANPFQVSSQTSIFGAPKEQQPTPAASSFSFTLGQQTPQQSVFGMATQSAPQPSTFGVAQPIQQQQPQSGSIFGGQPSQPFGASSVFASPPQQQAQQANSIFGSSVFAQSQPAPPGVFGSAQQIPSQNSTFSVAQPSNNIFGSFQTQPNPLVQNTGNIFAQPSVQPSQSVFSMNQSAPVQPPLPPATGSIFQIQQPAENPQQSPFAVNPFQTQPTPVDESAYSKPEDLTPDEMQAFQAESFQLGSIPLKPPPRNFCT